MSFSVPPIRQGHKYTLLLSKRPFHPSFRSVFGYFKLSTKERKQMVFTLNCNEHTMEFQFFIDLVSVS
uniref:Uncharacterized protein n=1 Tax=Rhizophora mucronata TaxID=61149 RepID=A0A2P2NHP0_RHIMU